MLLEWKGKVIEHDSLGLILEKDKDELKGLENIFYQFKGKQIKITIEECKEIEK